MLLVGICNAGSTVFDASQYAFFGNDVVEEVELGGLEAEEDDALLSGFDEGDRDEVFCKILHVCLQFSLIQVCLLMSIYSWVLTYWVFGLFYLHLYSYLFLNPWNNVDLHSTILCMDICFHFGCLLSCIVQNHIHLRKIFRLSYCCRIQLLKCIHDSTFYSRSLL